MVTWHVGLFLVLVLVRRAGVGVGTRARNGARTGCLASSHPNLPVRAAQGQIGVQGRKQGYFN